MLIDVSDYDLPTWNPACFKAAEVTQAIVNSFSKSNAITRIQTLRAAGIEVIGVYGFCYFGPSDYYVNRDVDAAIELAQTFSIPMVWVDAELDAAGIGVAVRPSNPDERVGQLATAVAKVEAAGLPVGIYTAGWWWPPNTGNFMGFSNLPLWHADYGANDGTKAPVTTVNYGGWTTVAIHQYTSTKVLCGRGRDHNYKLYEPEEDEMTKDQEALLIAVAQALAGPATGQTGNVVAELTKLIIPMAVAPLYSAIQNQQAAFTEHVGHPVFGQGPVGLKDGSIVKLVEQ